MVKKASTSTPQKTTAAAPKKAGTVAPQKASSSATPKKKASPSKVGESTSAWHLETLAYLGVTPQDFISMPRTEVLNEELEDEAMLEGTTSSPFDEQAYCDTLIAQMEKCSSENRMSYEALIREKRKQTEQLVANANAKKQKRAKSSWFHRALLNIEEGRSSNYTTFKLPLYTHVVVEHGFSKFAICTLTDGLHDRPSELTEVAILTMHTAHTLFRVVHKEAKMLADKEKYELLVQRTSYAKKSARR